MPMFEWDANKARANLTKRAVSFQETVNDSVRALAGIIRRQKVVAK